MKKVLGMVLGLALIATLAGCGGGMSDAEVIKAQKKAMDDFTASMEKAKDDDQMVAAIDALCKDMEALIPQSKALQEKYPNIKDGKDLPADLQKEMEGMEPTAKAMFGAMMKAAQSKDPKVQEAMKRLQNTMQGM